MFYLTKDELNNLLDTAKRHDEQHYLMMLVSYSHGLRVSEVISLTPANVKDGYLIVNRLKGSERTIQPLIGAEKSLLEALCKRVTGRLFPWSRITAWRLYQKYGRLAGIDGVKCHPHIMKHSIAKHSIKQAGIENVKHYLGHKSMNSTAAYLKVTDQEASQAIMSAIGE